MGIIRIQSAFASSLIHSRLFNDCITNSLNFYLNFVPVVRLTELDSALNSLCAGAICLGATATLHDLIPGLKSQLLRTKPNCDRLAENWLTACLAAAQSVMRWSGFLLTGPRGTVTYQHHGINHQQPGLTAQGRWAVITDTALTWRNTSRHAASTILYWRYVCVSFLWFLHGSTQACNYWDTICWVCCNNPT